MQRFAKLAANALNQVLESPVLPSDLEIPPDPKLGDLAFPCFKLAKALRKAPPQIAAQLVQEIQAKGAVPANMTVATAGPYVNFTVTPGTVFKEVVTDILKPSSPTFKDPLGDYGRGEAQGKTWVLEYSSPNVAKPLNIYHLRSTALGAALGRIGKFRGLNVVTINHLGDWGKQYGMLTVAFKRFGKTIESNLTMTELVELYVKINDMAKTDATIEAEARQAFLKLEQGDPEITALWKKCVDVSMIEFNHQYKRLSIEFDHIWGESYYKDQLAPLIADMKKQGILIESEGAWVVPVESKDGKELPPCIVEKSDGATIYATRDLAAAIYRYGKFHFDRMTYIVGGEQRLHFEQVFAVLKKMGFEWADRLEHIPYGLYRFNNMKMSTRKGNFTTLDGVIELAKERVETLMNERIAAHPGSPQPTEEIMEAIAVGAVVFNDLSIDPARDVNFDLEKVVNFEGETGPYLQYAHTRCLSILRKAQESGKILPKVSDPLLAKLGKPEELALVKVLGQLTTHLDRTLNHAKASQLTNFAIDIAKAFGAFYRECKVLDDTQPELTQARLLLVESTRIILARSLSLLGIPLPERM